MKNKQLKLFTPDTAWKKLIHKEITNWDTQYKMAKVVEEAKKQQTKNLGAGYISASRINKIEHNQVRAEDYDKGHVVKIKDEILNLKKTLMNLNFQKSSGQLEKTSKIKDTKKQIARLNTKLSVISGEQNA